jgi:hypothetical protein
MIKNNNVVLVMARVEKIDYNKQMLTSITKLRLRHH